MSYNKLVLDSFELDAFHLCAIHSSLPSYKMAFLLNKYLGLQFTRFEKDIQVVSEQGLEVYPCYVYEDKINYTHYSLLKNKCFFENNEEKKKDDLFANELGQQIIKNLIPEYKKVDFFLKVETDNYNYSLKLLVSKITKINQVIASFEVDYESIKSKTNLIIE